MSTQDDADIVVGKDGQEGYLSGAQKEALVESGSDLAGYKDLKFRVDDDDHDETSGAVKAVGALSSTLKHASTEIVRLRGEAEGRELADGVEQLLDAADEVADGLDWGEADELQQAAEIRALQSASVIADDDLRQATFAKLEERIDADLYQAFVEQWQGEYVEQTEADIQAGWEQAQAENEKQLKQFAAVVTLEDDLLATLGPLEQACAQQLLNRARDDIVELPPAEAQEMIRTVMEMARDVAFKVEQADAQMKIVKAHGRTKAGIDGRRLKELDLGQLGLLPTLEASMEEVEAANARAKKGVGIDRQAAKRIHKGQGPTGMEKLQAQTVARAKAMGVPVHDGATGQAHRVSEEPVEEQPEQEPSRLRRDYQGRGAVPAEAPDGRHAGRPSLVRHARPRRGASLTGSSSARRRRRPRARVSSATTRRAGSAGRWR